MNGHGGMRAQTGPATRAVPGSNDPSGPERGLESGCLWYAFAVSSTNRRQQFLCEDTNAIGHQRLSFRIPVQTDKSRFR